ncbi:hypothetical protein PHSC3_000077 [Chlamydiales bacterium STE3]|nr:hypothetical protein PHSC3_000077 [Chlamydiales bacterium STE3]
MPIDSIQISHLHYIPKNSLSGSLNNKKLTLKKIDAHHSPQKINRLILEKRIVQLEYRDQGIVLKTDALWSEMLGKHQFTALIIKPLRGEEESTISDVHMETLTAQESEALNLAITQFLDTPQTTHEHEEKNSEKNASKNVKAFSSYPPNQQQRTPLSLSDYLDKIIFSSKAEIGLDVIFRNDRRQEEKKAREEEEKKDELNRSLLKKEIEKWELNRESIKKEEGF